MKYSTKISLWVVLAAVLAACSPLLPAPPVSVTATPTPDLSMAQTLTAVPTMTDTPLPPTESPTATQTEYPTITPAPSLTPIPSFTPIGVRPTSTPMMACAVVEKSPENWESFKPRESFDGIWKVKNTGSTNWNPQRVVFKFLNGARLFADAQEYKLKADVKPGSQVLLIADLVAPKGRGEYASTWGLVDLRFNSVFCSFTVKITVE